jgi:hypothetical protein
VDSDEQPPKGVEIRLVFEARREDGKRGLNGGFAEIIKACPPACLIAQSLTFKPPCFATYPVPKTVVHIVGDRRLTYGQNREDILHLGAIAKWVLS